MRFAPCPEPAPPRPQVESRAFDAHLKAVRRACRGEAVAKGVEEIAEMRAAGEDRDLLRAKADGLLEAALLIGLSELGALDRAVIEVNAAVVRALLQHGASAASAPAGGLRDPLLIACLRGGLHSALPLLQHGASPSVRGVGLETPLTEASKLGVSPLVLALLTRGADPNCDDRAGMTPLAYALGGGCMHTFDALRCFGADAKAPLAYSQGGDSRIPAPRMAPAPPRPGRARPDPGADDALPPLPPTRRCARPRAPQVARSSTGR